MPHLYETKLWRLQLPDTWRVGDGCDQDSVTFFRPDRVVILRVHSGFIADVLAPLQGGQGEEFQGLLSGRTYGETNGDTFTRTWALSCHGQRLWVRYTCSAGNAELERLEVDEILRSICEAA